MNDHNPNELGSANRFILKDESYAVIGAALDVYYKLGSGFLEPVYQEALELEFQLRDIPFASQVDLPIVYKEFTIKKTYRADFVCYESYYRRDQGSLGSDSCRLGSTHELLKGISTSSRITV